MMQVHDIIFCLNSSNIGGQGVNAYTVLSAVNPEYIPGLFSFSTIVTIIGIDCSKDHVLKLIFYNEEETVGALEGPLTPIDDSSNLPDEYKGINPFSTAKLRIFFHICNMFYNIRKVIFNISKCKWYVYSYL